jgi:hypothetical protein
MGTVIPLGFAVAEQIEKDSAEQPFDLAVLAGDLAYATVSPPKDEFEAVWDAWGRMIQPYTATLPFMVCVGNHGECTPRRTAARGGKARASSAASTPPPPHRHVLALLRARAEHTPGKLTNASGTYSVDYAAYQARYAAVPPNGNTNLWYSYDFGAAHYVYIDSEEAQTPGSPQIEWLAADLAAVDRSVTPWLFLFQHRPLLCSTTSEEGDHVPGGTFLRNLEALILAHKVDVVITGCEAQRPRGSSGERPSLPSLLPHPYPLSRPLQP